MRKAGFLMKIVYAYMYSKLSESFIGKAESLMYEFKTYAKLFVPFKLLHKKTNPEADIRCILNDNQGVILLISSQNLGRGYIHGCRSSPSNKIVIYTAAVQVPNQL